MQESDQEENQLPEFSGDLIDAMDFYRIARDAYIEKKAKCATYRAQNMCPDDLLEECEAAGKEFRVWQEAVQKLMFDPELEEGGGPSAAVTSPRTSTTISIVPGKGASITYLPNTTGPSNNAPFTFPRRLTAPVSDISVPAVPISNASVPASPARAPVRDHMFGISITVVVVGAMAVVTAGVVAAAVAAFFRGTDFAAVIAAYTS